MKNYNQHNEPLFIPSKLIYFSSTGGEKPKATEKAQNSPKFKEQLIKTKENLNQKFKSVQDSKEFKELHKLDWIKANDLVKQFKEKALGKDSEVMGNLDAVNFNASNKSLKELLTDLGSITSKFNDYTAKFLKKMEQESTDIKKQRKEALDTFLKKTLPKDIVKEMVESYAKGTEVSAEVRKQALDFGAKLALEGADKLSKSLIYDNTAFKKDANDPKKLIVDEMADEVKPHVDKVDKGVETFINNEMERTDAMPEEEKDTLLTYTKVGEASNENRETRSANEQFIKDHIEKRIKAGESVTITLTGNTSAEGNAKYNEQLANQRAEAKKSAMIQALNKVMGSQWKGKVDFVLKTRQVEPKLTKSDLPTNIQKKYETDPKYKMLKLILGSKLQDAMKYIDSQKKPADKLNAIVKLFAGDINVGAVLGEYNKYMNIKTNSKLADAEKWLQTKSKYLKNNPALLVYLHKYIGRARSAEVRVQTAKEAKESKDQAKFISEWSKDILNHDPTLIKRLTPADRKDVVTYSVLSSLGDSAIKITLDANLQTAIVTNLDNKFIKKFNKDQKADFESVVFNFRDNKLTRIAHKDAVKSNKEKIAEAIKKLKDKFQRVYNANRATLNQYKLTFKADGPSLDTDVDGKPYEQIFLSDSGDIKTDADVLAKLKGWQKEKQGKLKKFVADMPKYESNLTKLGYNLTKRNLGKNKGYEYTLKDGDGKVKGYLTYSIHGWLDVKDANKNDTDKTIYDTEDVTKKLKEAKINIA
jgi:hypothetical protein